MILEERKPILNFSETLRVFIALDWQHSGLFVGVAEGMSRSESAVYSTDLSKAGIVASVSHLVFSHSCLGT